MSTATFHKRETVSFTHSDSNKTPDILLDIYPKSVPAQHALAVDPLRRARSWLFGSHLVERASAANEEQHVGRMHLNHHSPNVCGMIISENTTVSVEHCCCSSYSHADRSASGGYRDRWHQSYYTVRPGYRAFVWLLHAGLGSATDCQMAERSLFAGWRHVDCPGG